MFSTHFNIIGFVLTLITVVHSLFACVISLLVFFRIISHVCSNHVKRTDKILLLHCMNIYFWILIYMIILSSMNIQTILGDLYSKEFVSSWCIFLGYLSPTILCVLYHAFVNQAFFRLCRIVYSEYRWLQFRCFYLIIPPIELIVALLLLSPLLFWHDVIYLSNEHYCYAAFRNYRGILWTAFIAYGIPASCLFVMYIRIAIFIRQQSGNTQTQARKRRQARDLLAIRRIVVTVGVLIFLGVPSVVLVIMSTISGEEYPLSFRITWISLSISMAGLALSMIFFIPQLKSIVWKKQTKNRVIPINTNFHGSIQMRTFPTDR